MEQYRGGCSCGQVRFELDDNPLWILACHCDACKKRTGSAYGVSIAVNKASVRTFVGETRSFSRTGKSGNPVRYDFCPNCGTTLRWHVDIVPNREMFAAGTLDTVDHLRVHAEMFTDEALPWALLNCELSCRGGPDDDFRASMVARAKRCR
jgi:hypothetical protein